MNPLYIFLLMWAVFITGLSDGISMALAPIPGLGIVLAFAITLCINATMGAGLLFLLALNGMYHPRLSPFGIVGGLVPGLNFLPFWVGLVVAGIIYKRNAEGEDLAGISGVALNLQSTYQSGASPLSKFTAAKNIIGNSRLASGRPPASQAANDNEPQEQVEKSRSPLNLKSPSINSDIAPQRTQPYAKAA